MAALLDAGYADDWGIASGIAECLVIILEALSHSSLPPDEQLLWYIDAEQKDEYGIFDGTEDFIKKRGYKKADWRVVAAVLEKRLQAQPVPRDNTTFSGRYQRENLSRWLQTSLEKGGRQTDIIDLLQREAPITHSYDKLVSALLTAGRAGIVAGLSGNG